MANEEMAEICLMTCVLSANETMLVFELPQSVVDLYIKMIRGHSKKMNYDRLARWHDGMMVNR